MSHRNASDRAAWLDALAGTLARNLDTNKSTLEQTTATLHEIASWIRDRGDSDGLPPDTVWVHVDGPAVYYFNREGRPTDTLWQARLDKAPSVDGADPLAGDSRQHAIAQALVQIAARRLDRGYLTDVPPVLPRDE